MESYLIVDMSQIIAQYENIGFATFSLQNSPFSMSDWNSMKRVIPVDASSYKYTDKADTKESTSLGLLALLREGNPPRVANAGISIPVIEILGSKEKLAFYEKITGESRLMIRRSQIHMMLPGGHIGVHRDNESNKHYIAAVVLQFEIATAGGNFIVYDAQGKRQLIREFAMLVTDANLPHEVTRVEAGRRVTVVYWLAEAV